MIHRVHKWIELINRKQEQIYVGSVCFTCMQSGRKKEKTVIALPDILPQKGLITIEKPLGKVELIDIIKLYSKINN